MQEMESGMQLGEMYLICSEIWDQRASVVEMKQTIVNLVCRASSNEIGRLCERKNSLLMKTTRTHHFPTILFL